MLYLLLAITILYALVNLIVQEYDYMHPAFLFSFVFFVYTLMCVVNRATYEIELHAITVVVITLGLSAFTLVGAMGRRLRHNGTEPVRQTTAYSLKKIHISNWIVIGCILVQLVTIAAFIRYLHELTAVFNTTTFAITENRQVSESSLTAQMDLFDTLTKFWSSLYASMNVKIPVLYRIGNPLTSAAAYIMIYVAVHNFLADHSVNPLHIAVILLECVRIVLNGSRSPLFRVITMILILFYVLTIRNGRYRKGDRKVLLRIGVTVLLAGIGFMLLLNLMGRVDDKSSKINEYLFIYVGAEIVNLDTFLTRELTTTSQLFFGMTEGVGLPVAQTLKEFYTYLNKLTGFQSVLPSGIGQFEYTANGIVIGNVYTMFMKLFYDLGLPGVFFLTALEAGYFCLTYDRMLDTTRGDNVGRNPLYFRLLIYSYLFNDLVMSAFSARFYETVFDAPFIKLLLVAWIYDLVLFRRKLFLGRYRVPLTNVDYRRNTLCVKARKTTV